MNVKKLKKAIRETSINSDCYVNLTYKGKNVAHIKLPDLKSTIYDSFKELEEDYCIEETSSLEWDDQKKNKRIYLFEYQMITIIFDDFYEWWI